VEQNDAAPGSFGAAFAPAREPQGTHTTSSVAPSKACAKAAPQTHAPLAAL